MLPSAILNVTETHLGSSLSVVKFSIALQKFRVASWWRHQMKTFSALLAALPVPGEFPAQRPVTQSFDVFCVWLNGWVNTREAGDLRRYHAHYDVIVMYN